MSFIRKEFKHVMRDRKTLLILFGMPIVQILIFGFALSNEIKESNIVVFDQSQSELSRKFIEKVSSGQYFEIAQFLKDKSEMENSFKSGKIKLALVIPSDFETKVAEGAGSSLQIVADASDPNTATVLSNYIASIARDFQIQLSDVPISNQLIKPEVRMLYNPQLKGAPNFVPGVMALVLMLICVMMTAVSIVREKETGTMEILLVSPFHPFMVIIAKAIPYLFISLLNVTTILMLSVWVLDLPVNGSLFLLYAESTLFIAASLAIGIFISIKTSSQQVAMLISLMGMMLPTILFSGFMFPIENMPLPLQYISNIIPAKWFYIIVKSIMIKGLGMTYIWKETLILFVMTLFFFILSLKNFKIRLA
ncbi:MAG: ABC transporter permease [Bacteroidetes bacterium]|nr:ABC transporter permease [Bacteroidota bacterium]